MLRLANLAECQMPSPPTVKEFVDALQKVKSPAEEADTLLGEIPPPDLVPVKDYRRERMAAPSCFTEYMGVCAAHGVQHATLDECSLGWARWCIDARELYSTPQQQLACVAVRTERAG
eukprot:EG_transcript_43523